MIYIPPFQKYDYNIYKTKKDPVEFTREFLGIHSIWSIPIQCICEVLSQTNSCCVCSHLYIRFAGLSGNEGVIQ